MKGIIRRPGSGWIRLGIAPVYDHVSGVRVHIMGLCQINGEIINGMVGDEDLNLRRAILAQGGNRKRGAMVWALRKLQEKGKA